MRVCKVSLDVDAKNTPVPHLNKGFSSQEKGDKNFLSRVAKLRSVVALLHG